MDKVVHFELPVDNAARAKKFYKETFSWETEDYPEMDYILVKTTEKGENAINGGMFKRTDDCVTDCPTFSVSVENIDEAIKKIKNAGGLVLKDKTPVGNMGTIAYFKDTEGNILSVFQPAKKMQ